jgi:predicted alpha/beta-fold hydrolase
MGATEINNAYGGAYDPAVHGPTHSPIEYMAGLPFPMIGFYATDDPLIPQATTNAADALPNMTYYSLGAVGHGGLAMANAAAHPQFTAFVAACAAAA